jgi:hypothetical protein
MKCTESTVEDLPVPMTTSSCLLIHFSFSTYPTAHSMANNYKRENIKVDHRVFMIWRFGSVYMLEVHKC